MRLRQLGIPYFMELLQRITLLGSRSILRNACWTLNYIYDGMMVRSILAVTRYSVTFTAVYIALIPYNLLALHNQRATQQLFDFQNQLRSNVAVIAEQVKER